MTNIANKIYNHATVLAGNLRAKGVPDITANMGLADLIDKVLDIDQTSNGLYLFSDKKIAQSGNTVNLSSMILEDKQIKPGETITFYYTFVDKKMKDHEEIQIPSQFQNYDWDITIEKKNTQDHIVLTKENSPGYVLLGDSILMLSSSNQVLSVNNPCYKIRGNTIYFDDNSVEISEGLDKTKVSNFSSTSPHVSITALIPVVVQNNGLATYSMTCNGSGKKSFYTSYGNFVSEPYNVWDTYKWDTGTISSHNDIWNYNDATTVLTRYDEYSSITEKVSGTDARMYCKNLPTSATIDIELCQIDGGIGNGGLNFYDNESYRTYFSLQDMGYTSSTIGQWVRLRVTYGNGSITATSLDDPTKTVTKSYNNNITSFSPSTNGAITEHRFRNMKVYSI